MANILSVRNLSKTYQSGTSELHVLQDITFDIRKGESFAIVGPSGSGKTTLLGLCAGLDKADTGSIELCGTKLETLNGDQRALLRNEHVGFIFQDYQLLPTLTALENVMVPMELRGVKEGDVLALELMERVGLGERIHHYPSQLSGGEQQRVALARAFTNNPSILFADEPTGNLDEETGDKVISLLFDLNREAGTTLVIVSHDMELANKCDNILRLKGGKIMEETSHP